MRIMRGFSLSLKVGLGGCLIVLILALTAPLIAPYAPDSVSLDMRFLPPGLAHWAGTDEAGRDVLSRILWGLRLSLAAGVGVAFTAGFVGAVLGSISGYFGGITDTVLMRIMDMIMSLPGLVIAMALTAALGANLVNAALALTALSIPYFTRLARARALVIAQQNYVQASKVIGASAWYQLRVNIFPNVLPQLLVVITLHVGTAILSVASLSFIGLGAQPPAAELGYLVNAGRRFILEQWWCSVLPGAAILFCVFSFNLLGDGLRDLLDPRAGQPSQLR